MQIHLHQMVLMVWSGVASITPETIVASYQAGRFVLDDDAIYEPGVRLYFDNHRIIRDNQIVRDGLHTAKVHKRLPLSPYLLAAIGVHDLDPRRKVKMWTPRLFVERSDEAFWSQYATPRETWRRLMPASAWVCMVIPAVAFSR